MSEIKRRKRGNQLGRRSELVPVFMAAAGRVRADLCGDAAFLSSAAAAQPSGIASDPQPAAVIDHDGGGVAVCHTGPRGCQHAASFQRGIAVLP